MNRESWRLGGLAVSSAFLTDRMNSIGQPSYPDGLPFPIGKLGPQTAIHPPLGVVRTE